MTSTTWYLPPAYGYFMNKEHEDAVMGRALAARKEARLKVSKLRAEMETISSFLAELARALKDKPEGIVFEKQSFEGKFPVSLTVDATNLDAVRIHRLVDTYREQLTKLREAEAQIKRFDQA